MAKRFLYKLLIFLSPFILIVAVYIINDPFKVLYKYDSYYKSGAVPGVGINRDYATLETLKKYYSKNRYDSYIFGNSRSLVFWIDEWKKYVNGSFFHFDASGESIYGIERKLDWLQAHRMPIKNALFVIDSSVLENAVDHSGHLFKKHPELSGEGNFAFQKEFIKSYFSPRFMFAYFDYLISGRVKPYMAAGFLLDEVPVKYDLLTNEVTRYVDDSLIEIDKEDFYDKRKHIFARKDTFDHMSRPVIGEKQLELLKHIASILKQNNAAYRIIISPLYDQNKLNPADLKILQELFSKENVFDFSGKNSITSDYHNYYETAHYRPNVAAWILKTIYQPAAMDSTIR